MVILKLEPQNVLAAIREILGLPIDHTGMLGDTLLAALVRRSAGIHCPCSRTTIRASLMECLRGIVDDGVSIADRIDSVIEGLIIGGDLLELNDVATADATVKGTWVFAAQPSFIQRPDGSVFLTGIVPDHDNFLPFSLASRIKHKGITRVIEAKPREDLPSELREQGLQEMSEGVWLKAPKERTAEEELLGMEQHLSSKAPSGDINNLQILDSARSVMFYKGRWTLPESHHTGNFIGRRPQDYGAPIWCFVTLENGNPVRLLDLPMKKTRWRACDVAWHLQMAIDSYRSKPQLYRRCSDGDEVCFSFFSPLPQWSERRLMIFGRREEIQGGLISYSLPANCADGEERFFQQRLWLARTEDSN